MATPSFVSLKLKSIIFYIWEQIWSLIKSQDLLGFIIGTIPPIEGEIIGPNGDDKVLKLYLVA
jgi:hypothetical protein